MDQMFGEGVMRPGGIYFDTLNPVPEDPANRPRLAYPALLGMMAAGTVALDCVGYMHNCSCDRSLNETHARPPTSPPSSLEKAVANHLAF